MAHKSKSSPNHETVAFTLLVAGLVGFFLFIWQIIYLPKNLIGYLNLSFSLFDFYLAFAFFKNKPKIKRTFLFRIFLGLICWLDIFYLLDIQYGLIWAKIGWLVALGLLGLNKLKKPVIFAILALTFLFTDLYSTAQYISYKQQLLLAVGESGKNQFTSKPYGYSLTTTANWKIIERNDFLKIKEKFLETEAEIALIAKNGQSFCLVIPNKLNKYLKDYALEKIKQALLESLTTRNTVKINKVDSCINKDKGFQIQYTDIIEGNRQDYIIIYLNLGDFDLKFIGWTLGNKPEKIYREIKNIARNTLANKNSHLRGGNWLKN